MSVFVFKTYGKQEQPDEDKKYYFWMFDLNMGVVINFTHMWSLSEEWQEFERLTHNFPETMAFVLQTAKKVRLIN